MRPAKQTRHLLKKTTNPKQTHLQSENGSCDCRATLGCVSGRLLSFTAVSFTFWSNNHNARDLCDTSLVAGMYVCFTVHEKSMQNAGQPQRRVQDRVNPVSKQVNIFRKVKSQQWLLLHKEMSEAEKHCLEKKNTVWPCADMLRSPAPLGFSHR